MNYNYHTHTVRCHHAVDSDVEYIERAIEAGIEFLGFSDHAPFMFPDGYESFYRVDMSEGEEYVKTIRDLAKKYSHKVQISVGFEIEYYPLYFDKMLENARKFGAEYLILGQHFLGNEHPDGIGTRAHIENPELLTEYVDSIISAIKTGVFTYIAHPDIIRFEGNDEHYVREMTRLCEAAKELDIPLEINLHGIANNRHYPSDRFFAIAGKIGSPVTFGFDAHESSALLDRDSLKIATELVKKHNLNYIGKPKLVPIYK